MIVSNNAEQMTAEQLKALIEEKTNNPTIERLMFIETRGREGRPGQIFPCYVEAWGEDENANVKTDPGLRFQLVIIQYAGGEFQMVRVVVMAEELGVSKRIWDRAPSAMQREMEPWVAIEKGVQ